jgi:hypothetical protein
MITIVNDHEGDWVAIYRDGKLLGQSHSFQEGSLLDLLGIEHKEIWDGNAEETGFRFPDYLGEVIRLDV